VAAILLQDFKGMIPLRANTLLPETNAAYAQNAWLAHGDIRGFRKPEAIHDIEDVRNTRAIYRVPNPYQPVDSMEGSLWLELNDEYTQVFRSPIVDDKYHRYYFFGPTIPPTYNTYDRLVAGEPDFLLGVPAPDKAPKVVATAKAPAVFSSTKSYIKDDFVTYGGRVYKAILEVAAGAWDVSKWVEVQETPPTAPDFSSDKAYTTGDMVTYKGQFFRANTTTTKAWDATKWTEDTTAPYAPPWNADSSYAAGDLVAYNGKFYKANIAVSAGWTASQWTLVSIESKRGVLVTRAYVTTYVTEYGEESAPSPPTVVVGYSHDVWTVTVDPPDGSITNSRNITHERIYRTIADGAGGANYYMVTEVPTTTTVFVDTTLDEKITGSTQLASTNWNTPPSDFQGAIVLPNGIIAAWRDDHEIWFSEPYRPHTFPSVYTIAVPFPIVGFGRAAQNLVVLTKGNPTVVTGIHPSTMAMTALAIKEPCISRRSILSTEDGVYYAAQNGLVLVQYGMGAAEIITKQLFTRQEWIALQPHLLMAVRVPGAYLAFVQRGVLIAGEVYDGSIDPGSDGSLPSDEDYYDGAVGPGSGSSEPSDGVYLDGLHSQFVPHADQMDNGCIIGGPVANTSYTRMKFDGLVQHIFQDEFTGENFVLSGGKIWHWDPPEGIFFRPWLWQSKVFQFPYKQAFMACKVFFQVQTEYMQHGPFFPGPVPHRSFPNKEDHLNVYFNPDTMLLLLRLRADDRVVFTREIRESGELVMLPSGFKADQWQLELEGMVIVTNIQLATSVKELARG